jgi:hypothetical protein
MEKVLVNVGDITHNASSFANILKHISGFIQTEGANNSFGLCSCKLQFSVAAYIRVGKDHKSVVRNNKRNQ